jgi:hypothetical protein
MKHVETLEKARGRATCKVADNNTERSERGRNNVLKEKSK